LLVVGVLVLLLGLPAAVAVRKAAGLRRLGTPVEEVTTAASAPAPLGAEQVGWQVRADGRIVDVAVVPAVGEVIYVEEVARRRWRATAVDARTGQVRWSNLRGHTGHIEAWAVTDAAVVLAYHHSASRLAWRTHHAASFEGLDPASGKVLWTRHIYNLLGDRPGDYAPTLASPSENVVYARTEFGVPNAIDTRTGKTLWERPGLNDCQAHEIVAGPAGVAISHRCPGVKERIELLNPRTGKPLWRTEISSPSVRLLAVGANSVALYQGGLVQQIIVLGPGGGYASQTPCACGDGASLQGGVTRGTVVVGGGPLGLLGAEGATGTVLWQKPVAGGPVHRVLAQEGYVHIVSGDGALIRVDEGTGAMQTLIPGAPGELDPDAIVVPVGGYLAAGSAKGFAFTGSGR
jgi:hypothetical protein